MFGSSRLLLALGIPLVLSLPAAAANLTGFVTNGSGFGVGGVDIDLHDPVTGVKIPTQNDTTDVDGSFDIIIGAGVYDVVFNAPQATRLVSLRLRSVNVVELETDLGIVALQPGALLIGQVVRQSSGTPVFMADTDIDLSLTGKRVVTPFDDTNASGNFSVVVPFGLVDLTIQPEIANQLVARRIIGIQVSGDVNVGTLSLESGFLVSGVTTFDGAPASGVDIDVFRASNGLQMPTPGVVSNGSGSYSLVLPAGTYDFEISPGLGRARRHLFLENVVVSGPLTLNLPVPVSGGAGVEVQGGRLVLAGGLYEPEIFVLNETGVPFMIQALVQVEFPAAGVIRDVLPPITTTLPAARRILSGSARLRIPGGLAPRFRDVPLHFVVTLLDGTGQAVIDADRTEFRVR